MPMPARALRRTPAAVAALAAALLCAACSKPEPPDTERPPEPQAEPAQPADAVDATELRDAIRQPVDRAKAVEGQVEDAAAKQRAAMDAQTGY